MSSSRYPSNPVDVSLLAEPIRFQTATDLVAKTRFMKSAMSEEVRFIGHFQLATWHKSNMRLRGLPDEKLFNLFERFGEGGFGLIVTGGIVVNSWDLDRPGNVTISDESDSLQRRAAFVEWTSAAKKHGSIFLAQIYHCGMNAAPYIQPHPIDISTATQNEIQIIINAFVYAALFAYETGFDGVEMNAGYFYLPGAFVSPVTNTRTDNYGGSLENRTRIIFEIYEQICRLVDRKKFLVGLKLNSMNFQPEYDEFEFKQFCDKVQNVGFDYVTLTGGHYNQLKNLDSITRESSRNRETFYQTYAEAARSIFDRTVLYMNGGFVTAEDMADAVASRWTDGISIARAVAAEPDLPNKIIHGQVDAAIQPLIDPLDFPTAKEVAGTQLWQHANGYPVIDASDATQMGQFAKELADHRAINARRIENGQEPIVGFTKFRVRSSHNHNSHF